MVSTNSSAEKIHFFDAKMEIAREDLASMKNDKNTPMLIHSAVKSFKMKHKQLIQHQGTLLGSLIFLLMFNG